MEFFCIADDEGAVGGAPAAIPPSCSALMSTPAKLSASTCSAPDPRSSMMLHEKVSKTLCVLV